MPFETPTLDEEHEFLVAHFKSLRPTDDVSPDSFNWLWLKTVAAGITGNHAHVVNVKNDLMPDTAEGDMLDRWAAIRGVTRKSATPARKADALRITGTVGASIPAGTALVHTSGLRFATDGVSVVGAGGFIDADVYALDVGSATRLAKGETLTFETPIGGVEEIAELQKDLDEDGTDQERDGALRERVLSRFSSPALGGAAADYEQWALEETGIADAYAYPLRRGAGSVDLVAFHEGSGTSRVLTEGERVALEATIHEKRPVSVAAFRVLKVIPSETDVEVTLIPDGTAEHEFDWTDSSPPVVLTWDGTLRKLTFATARPATMDAGDRIIIKNAAGTGTGRERVIEALSGTDAVILEADATGDVPAASDVVYSGGPLVEPVRAAIQELFDSLGAANPDSNRYGPWEGNLRKNAIARSSLNVDGVLDATVLTPSATVEASDPEFPDDEEIGLLIAGRILVRREW